MGKIVLVEPFCESNRLDKFVQASAAKGVFVVPPAEFCYGQLRPTLEEPEVVIKSLSGNHVDGKGIFTTKVDQRCLSPEYPWYVQKYASAKRDLTVVYVRGKLFSFYLDRFFIDQTPDWRLHSARFGPASLPWKFITMPAAFEERVRSYMQKLRLHFGRLDFLWDGDSEYTFCEVNPNGQFAWLDLGNETGLLSTIAQEIDPEMECIPIPYCPYLS